MTKFVIIISLLISTMYFSERPSAMQNITLEQAYAIAQTALDEKKGIPEFYIDGTYTKDFGYGWVFVLRLKDKNDKGWFGAPICIAVTKDEGRPYVIYPINGSSENIEALINNDRKRRNIPPVQP